MQDTAITDDLLPITDQDVEALFQIVSAAQQAPGRPLRELFGAYDKLLKQQRIQPEDGHALFRFLLRLGKLYQEHDGTMFDCFESLLDQLGIQIEVDGDGDEVEDITRQIRDMGLETAQSPDTNQDSAGRLIGGSISANNRASSHAIVDGRSPWREPRNYSRSMADSHSVTEGLDPTRGTLTTHTRRHSTDGRLMQRQPARQPHRYGPQLRRASEPDLTQSYTKGALRLRGNAASDYEIGKGGRTKNNNPYGRNPLVKPLAATKPQKQQRDIEYINPLKSREDGKAESQLLGKRAYNVFQTWRESTTSTLGARDDLYEYATVYDRRALLRQGVDQWLARAKEKRQERETELLFEHLGRRIGHSRAAFLVSRAFTHWVRRAGEEAMRLSVARRTILRAKFFGAWREVTVVDDIKIRRHRMRKLFGILRRKAAYLHDCNLQAQDFRSKMLCEKACQAWMSQYSDHRFSRWICEKRVTYCLSTWLTESFRRKSSENSARTLRVRKMHLVFLQEWHAKAVDVVKSKSRAFDFRRLSLLSRALKSWRLQSLFSPISRQHNQKWQTINLKLTFNLLTSRSHALWLAITTDHHSLLKRHFAILHQAFRCRLFFKQIDDSAMAATLDLYVTTTRITRFRRRWTNRTLRNCLLKWHDTALNQRQRVDHSHDQVTGHYMTICRSALATWKGRLTAQKSNDEVARCTYRRHSTRDAFTALFSKHAHLQKLNTQSLDGNYYLACLHTLRQWRAATQNSRRQKRREAFMAIRRKGKKNLLCRVYRILEERAQHLIMLEHESSRFAHNWTLQKLKSLLAAWQTRVNQNRITCEDAAAINNRKVLTFCLSAVASKAMDMEAMIQSSEVYRAEAVDHVASSMLKKLNWRVFQIRRQEETAVALGGRYTEKRNRNILRHWADEALSARADNVAGGVDLNGATPLTVGRNRRSALQSKDNAYVRELSLRLANDTSPLPVATAMARDVTTTATPLPAYLRTPSMRSGRARSRFKVLGSSVNAAETPATAPAKLRPALFSTPTITPFGTRLRERNARDPSSSIGRLQTYSVRRIPFRGRSGLMNVAVEEAAEGEG